MAAKRGKPQDAATAERSAGGTQEDRRPIEVRLRALEETVSGLAAWAADTHRVLVHLAQHLEDLVAERLVPRPPPPPPIKPKAIQPKAIQPKAIQPKAIQPPRAR